MIESRENSIRELLVKLPALFVDNFRANEKVIIKLLECYPTEIEKMLCHQNLRKENILHVLIDKGFCHALRKVTDSFDVTNLCFERNLAGDSPLMTMIPKHSFGDQKVALWQYMLMNKKENLILEIDNMRVQARMERWPASQSIQE